jgi:hypothetical protein
MMQKLVLESGIAVLALGFAASASATTVIATYNQFEPAGQTIRRTITGGPTANQTNALLNIGRFNMTQTGGTSLLDFLGASAPGDFLAFCIEPQQTITLGVSITYNVVPLAQGANNIGGIGATKAMQISELFGRFAPMGGYDPTFTSIYAAALQVSIWEIVREAPTNMLDLATGNISFGQSSNSAVFAQAQTFLNALDGTGPMARGLRVLQNGEMGNVNNGTQDLLVFTMEPIPEPQTWAMLIAGFGLVGAAMRRRRLAVA